MDARPQSSERPHRLARGAARSGTIVPVFRAALSALSVLAAAGPGQAQTIATPFTQNDVTLTNLATEITYTVDFSTLPLRPNLVVEAVPDASHVDMQIELRVTNCNFDYPNEFFTCPATTTSTPTVGTQSLVFKPWSCGAIEPNSPPYVGKTCDVKVRALGFGSAGAPATLDVSIVGETEIPTATLSEEVTTGSLQSVSIAPTKDTTIYQANSGSSNGAGDSFWTSLGTGANALHALLAFNVQANVPAGASIYDVRLDLHVLETSGQPGFEAYAVPRNGSIAWVEGNANAAGNESTPPTPLGSAATWSHRQWFSTGASGPWSTAGGDRELPALATGSPGQTGVFSLASPDLLDHVRKIHTNTTTYDGLLLVPTAGAARFASDENTTASLRPRLVVQYFESTQTGVGNPLETGTTPYFTERQNFRWIYDLDNDNVLITPVTGRCEYTLAGANNLGLPYTYQYQGTPTYQGLDCCTWQLGSAAGVTGTGQAIFYVNTDSSNPANQPGDLDLDGIKDLCDNCETVPNGPLFGTCTAGPHTGSTCLSDQQCDDFPCSLSQDDADRDGVGDACVPEPGMGALLGGGMLALIVLERRHRAAAPSRLKASC